MKKARGQETSRKRLLRFFMLFACMFALGLASCSDTGKLRENIYHGMYDGANQMQEINHPDPVASPGDEKYSYEQYKEEREELVQEEP